MIRPGSRREPNTAEPIAEHVGHVVHLVEHVAFGSGFDAPTTPDGV